MKRKVSAVVGMLSLFLVVFPTSILAMCPGIFFPPNRAVHPDDNTKALLVYNQLTKYEALVLEPTYHGAATDFSMVLPVPSRPRLEEAPEDLFTQLEDLTNPQTFRGGGFGALSGASFGSAESVNRVRIVDTKDVGDFSTTTLTATSTQALTDWLDENGYTYTDRDQDNFEYYVALRNAHFVVFKVNPLVADVSRTGEIDGKLKPIEIIFHTERPMLPLRIMASDMEVMKFTVYTLSSVPVYIPGIDIEYSQQVGLEELKDAPALARYNAPTKYLVRNAVRFDPAQIEEDLYLLNGNVDLVVASPANPKRINSQLTPEKSGVLPGTGFNIESAESPYRLNVLDVISLRFVFWFFVAVIIVLVLYKKTPFIKKLWKKINKQK